jgi:hypothetical protein
MKLGCGAGSPILLDEVEGGAGSPTSSEVGHCQKGDMHYVEQPWAKTQRSPFAAGGSGEGFRPPFCDHRRVRATR